MAFLIGGLAIAMEYRPIKDVSFFTDWYDAAPFWMLLIWTIVCLVIDVRRYLSSKKLLSFSPLFLCLIFVSIVMWHQKTMEALDNSPTQFTATNDAIGSDGGFVLDFKVNGYLKAEKRDRFSVTYYRGRYTQLHDTIVLNIPLNFHLAKRGLLRNDSLCLIGDTTRFYVLRQ